MWKTIMMKWGLAVVLMLGSGFAARAETPQPLNPGRMVGSDRDAHGCIPSAGYVWCGATGKCQRPWEEPCAISRESCEKAGGRFDACSSKCRLMNRDNPEVVCPENCETLCICGGFAGARCPEGFTCKYAPGVVNDAAGYCE